MCVILSAEKRSGDLLKMIRVICIHIKAVGSGSHKASSLQHHRTSRLNTNKT